MADPTAPGPAKGSGILDSHPALVYSAARLGLFVVTLPPLYLLGMRGVLLLAFALVISGLLSLVLLHGLRARMSGRVSGFFGRMNERIDAAAQAEDEAVDRAEAQSGPDAEAPSGSARDRQADPQA